MKKLLLASFLSLYCFAVCAQENNSETHGTIRVEKKGQLAKIVYDNVNYRLVGIDQYGNVCDSAVLEFTMGVTINGIYYEEKTVGSNLSLQMEQLLGKCDQKGKIIFDKIKAKDRNRTVVNMPKFIYNIGVLKEDGE